MGLRCHRSIRICKGLRLNISGSGIGLSVGVRGASVSFGPRGTYVNVGIPGTGISYREKIGDSSRKTSGASQAVPSRPVDIELIVKYILDDDGKERIEFYRDGTLVTDESLIRRVKRTDQYKEWLQESRKKVVDKVENDTEDLLTLTRHCIPRTDWDMVRTRFESMKPERYIRRVYGVRKPDAADAERVVAARAQKVTENKFILFRNKARIDYINNNRSAVMEEILADWQKEKDRFEENENRLEKIENDKFNSRFSEQKEYIAHMLSPNKGFLECRMDDLLSEIRLPVEFNVDYEIADDLKSMKMDIELPGMDCIAERTARILASGKASSRKKPQKTIKMEYTKVVFGLAFYFASVAFSLAPTISEVDVAGHARTIDGSTGHEVDAYLYHVVYAIDDFFELDFANIDPLLAIRRFNPEMDIDAGYEMKAIELS